MIVVRIFAKALKDQKISLSVRCRPDALARRGDQVEAAGHANSCVVGLEYREHDLDRLTNTIVVGDEAIPIDDRILPQGRPRYAGNDRRLTQQMLGRRLIAT